MSAQYSWAGQITLAGTDPEISSLSTPANGTPALNIDSVSNVGIGEASPTTKLHISKDTAGSPLSLFVNHTDSTNGSSDAQLHLRTETAFGGDPQVRFTVGSQPSTGDWAIGIDNSNTDAFKISNGTNLETDTRLTIDFQGNVGINTAPVSKFDVSGGIRAAQVVSDPCIASDFPQATIFYNDTSDYYCFCNGAGADVQLHAPATACF